MDYRQVQLNELNKKIEETKNLFSDPFLSDLAREELGNLEKQYVLLRNWSEIRQGEEPIE